MRSSSARSGNSSSPESQTEWLIPGRLPALPSKNYAKAGTYVSADRGCDAKDEGAAKTRHGRGILGDVSQR